MRISRALFFYLRFDRGGIGRIYSSRCKIVRIPFSTFDVMLLISLFSCLYFIICFLLFSENAVNEPDVFFIRFGIG